MSFNNLNISPALQQALHKKGFSRPSEIQERVIPVALSGKDVVGKSQTGTGKTAAFAIPLIERIVPGRKFSALVVVPTRELANQVKEEIASIAVGSRIRAIAVFGGQNVARQIDLLRRNPEIIVGTPGRILDLVSRRVLDFSKTTCLVLDEADKMYDMGFRDDVDRIISLTPAGRQTMLFSATMPNAILGLIEKRLKPNKVVCDLSEDNAPVDAVEQYFVMVHPREKVETLHRLLDNTDDKTLVFCHTKRTVDWLERQLYRRRIPALVIHGDKPQRARNRIIETFRRAPRSVLIATDVVARGIHVADIGTVVNFDFPSEPETYLHRIGRTARQGKKGTAISFCVSNREREELEYVAERNNAVIQQLR